MELALGAYGFAGLGSGFQFGAMWMRVMDISTQVFRVFYNYVCVFDSSRLFLVLQGMMSCCFDLAFDGCFLNAIIISISARRFFRL